MDRTTHGRDLFLNLGILCRQREERFFIAFQFTGESVRITVQNIEDLDQATARTDMALKVFIDGAEALTSIKEVLGQEPKGRGEVVLISRLQVENLSEEVEIRLPEKYSVSPAMAQAVKAIPGVVEVRTV